jgi:hypothetical protein
MFQDLFASSVDSASDETTHGQVVVEDGTAPDEDQAAPEQAAAGQAGDALAAGQPSAPPSRATPALSLGLATPAARPETEDEDERDGDALVAALGFAGLLALHRSRAHERRLPAR